MTHVRVEFPRKLAPGRLTARPWSSLADLVAGLPGIPGVPRCTYTATLPVCPSSFLPVCLSVFCSLLHERYYPPVHTDASYE